ncbi:MAG: hypothetical protein K0Q52_176 [Microbacterium sp.]|jgi:hypothetical protein|nr:hypothetical protein [Microbacterium sp.]
MSAATLAPIFPASLAMTGADQSTRRERETQGRHRRWMILPRYGTADGDRWTIIASPIPGEGNPAAGIENGQFANLAEAYEARDEAEAIDNGEDAD